MWVARSAPCSAKSSYVFVSKACADNKVCEEKYGIKKNVWGVRGCRGIGKKDMKLNDKMPEIKVDPETYRVTADGVELTCEMSKDLPLTQGMFLF